MMSAGMGNDRMKRGEGGDWDDCSLKPGGHARMKKDEKSIEEKKKGKRKEKGRGLPSTMNGV